MKIRFDSILCAHFLVYLQLRCRLGSEKITQIPCRVSITLSFLVSLQWGEKPPSHVLSYLNSQNTLNRVSNDIFQPVKKVSSSFRKSAINVRGCWDPDNTLLLAMLVSYKQPLKPGSELNWTLECLQALTDCSVLWNTLVLMLCLQSDKHNPC